MLESLAAKGRSRRTAVSGSPVLGKHQHRESMETLAKGLSVIRAFSRDSALRLCDVASVTSMAPATARRCLMALEQLGYIVRDGNLFYLRPKVLELTAAYVESMDLEGLAGKKLQSITEITGDRSSVSVLDGTDIVYVAHADVPKQVQLKMHLGSRFPAHATSAGRILLADLSPSALKRHLRASLLPLKSAQKLPSAVDDLKNAILKCQRTGYAATSDEFGCGVVSVAVPISDGRGRAVAALSSSSQSSRISATQLVKERLHLLQSVSRQITTELSPNHSLSFGARD